MTEPSTSLLVRCGNFFFRYRDAVFPVFFAAMLLLTAPGRPAGDARLDEVLDLFGIAVSGLGQALRVAVVGYAYIIRGGRGRKVYAEDLVTGGFFATSRNPLYVGNLLVVFGLFLIWNSPWMYAAGVPFYLFGYRAIVAAEEAYLRAKFGPAYDEYCRDVPRWLPDFHRLAAGLEGMAFNWRRVVLKEYGNLATWLGTTLLLLILEALHFAPFDAVRGRVEICLALMVLVVALWAFARWLKLSRRLRA